MVMGGGKPQRIKKMRRWRQWRWALAGCLDGLFLCIAEEEGRIREQPVARASSMLRKVFGYHAAR
jgi:hypothetical protein